MTSGETLTPERAEFVRLFRTCNIADARALALRQMVNAGGDEGLAWSNNLAMAERAEGRLERALDIHLSAAPAMARCTDPLLVAKSFNGTGLTYKLLGERDRSIEHLDRAFDALTAARIYYERAGNHPFAAAADNNIAAVLVLAGRPEDAHFYVDRARELFMSAGEVARAAESDVIAAEARMAEGDALGAFGYSSRAVSTLYGTDEVKAYREALETHERALAALKAEGAS